MLVGVAAGDGSDTDYENQSDDDDAEEERRRGKTVYANDADNWQSASDHEDIPLPQCVLYSPFITITVWAGLCAVGPVECNTIQAPQ